MDSRIQKLVSHFSQKGPVVLLESQSEDHPASQITYLAAKPKAILRAWGDHVSVEQRGTTTQQPGRNPWEALSTFRQQHDDWLFGYLGYELKNHIEKLCSRNPDPVQAPDLFFMVPEVLVAYDLQTGQLSPLKGEGELPEKSVLEEGHEWGKGAFELENLRPTTDKQAYIEKINRSRERIAEGDFYEITLSHQLSSGYRGDPAALYGCMKEVGPVPFGAYLALDGLHVCCQSPERFLRREGDRVFSQPIKGTSRRGSGADEDASLKRQLRASQKEKAENLMIVDLVRNDLSRIARRGTVEVPKLFEIQSFGTVHQMVSTISAESEVDDPVEVIKACFPMGSMTGAPKISAMRSIEELEDYRRGIYSGAIGYIKPDGDFDFNVVIRTSILTENKLYYSVGGAITSDSNPQKEWRETLLKAEALSTAVEKRSDIPI